jgi:hypothetical protein
LRSDAGDADFVQQVAAQLLWLHNCVLLDELAGREASSGTLARTYSTDVGAPFSSILIESELNKRQGRSLANVLHDQCIGNKSEERIRRGRPIRSL